MILGAVITVAVFIMGGYMFLAQGASSNDSILAKLNPLAGFNNTQNILVSVKNAVLGGGNDSYCDLRDADGGRVLLYLKDDMFRQDHVDPATGKTKILLGKEGRIYMIDKESKSAFVFDFDNISSGNGLSIREKINQAGIEDLPGCKKTTLSASIFDVPSDVRTMALSDLANGNLMTAIGEMMQFRLGKAGERVEQQLNDAGERTQQRLEEAGQMTENRLQQAGKMVEQRLQEAGERIQGTLNSIFRR